MGALAHEMYATFVNDEGGQGTDFSAVLPWLAGRGRSEA